jgi:hypothetical protein
MCSLCRRHHTGMTDVMKGFQWSQGALYLSISRRIAWNYSLGTRRLNSRRSTTNPQNVVLSIPAVRQKRSNELSTSRQAASTPGTSVIGEVAVGFVMA